MAGRARRRLERDGITLRVAVVLAMAVLAPLLIVTPIDAPQLASAGAIALMGSALIAFGLWYALLAKPTRPRSLAVRIDSRVFDTSEPRDPRHHPVRPRAPGGADCSR